jgi:hypothetical protein
MVYTDSVTLLAEVKLIPKRKRQKLLLDVSKIGIEVNIKKTKCICARAFMCVCVRVEPGARTTNVTALCH